MLRYLAITLLSFAALYSSCNNVKNTPNDNVATDTTDEANPFAGDWVREGFIDTLKATRSPRVAQGSEAFYRIPAMLGDTGFTYVYHEGGGQFRTVKRLGVYMIDWFEGEPFEISQAGPGRIKIGNTYFVHLNKGEGVPELVLFAGDYLLGDKPVRFTATGEIEGLDTFRYYTVQTDYFEPGADLDFVDLGKNREEHLTHTFEFRGDTLSISEIICLEPDEYGVCRETQKGTLKYQLVKK